MKRRLSRQHYSNNYSVEQNPQGLLKGLAIQGFKVASSLSRQHGMRFALCLVGVDPEIPGDTLEPPVMYQLCISSCKTLSNSLFAPGHKSRAEARPTGRAVSRERLGDWDGPMAV